MKEKRKSSKSKKESPESGDSPSQGVRRKYRYRRLVMTEGIKVPARLAMKMVGPDCAYYLYSQHRPEGKDK